MASIISMSRLAMGTRKCVLAPGFGAFIVRGDLDTIPGVAGLTEQVMVAQLIEYTETTTPSQVTNVDPNYLYNVVPAGTTLNAQITINGQMNPTLTMQFGEIQHWRFVN